jgi:kynureninase
MLYAQKMDDADPLKDFRSLFHIPDDVIYFCGNSLGLQPISVKENVLQELNDWASLGMDGHLKAKNPWVSYHQLLTKNTAELTGAKPVEVSTMNSLTVNLNLLFVSFFRPTKKRFKIITESPQFSSDSYMLEQQCRFHGLDPKKAIVEIKPRKGEYILRTEDIIHTIKKHSKELALVFMSGINYYTGQLYDLKKICEAAHKAGAYAGFDLAHAAGNVELQLHKWKIDFAAWCTYKYLNAGPGATGQIFVHQEYAKKKELPRFAGWWGHNEKERFLMKPGFKPMPGAEGWAQSNDNILSMASLKASLEIFHLAGMKNLAEKSKKLTSYLEFLIKESKAKDPLFNIKIITPKERGAQLSVLVRKDAKKLYEILLKEKFIVDYRNPDVIRIAPVPLYNSFEEVYKLGSFLNNICSYEHK